MIAITRAEEASADLHRAGGRRLAGTYAMRSPFWCQSIIIVSGGAVATLAKYDYGNGCDPSCEQGLNRG